MRIFLLGAGASKGYDQSPSGLRMPVAKDFFETFDKTALSENPWVLIEGLIGYIEENRGRGTAYDFLRSGIDIEDLHSEIEEARDQALHSKDELAWLFPYRAFNELVFLFSAVLNYIQNGPISQAHLNLVNHLKPDDVIITFNWDTLIERALNKLTSWQPDWGYGLTPRTLYSDGWREAREPSNVPSNLLLKLHGSTNWLTGHTSTDGLGKIVSSQDIDLANFAVFETACGPYPCFAGRYMPDYQPYSYGYYPPNLNFPGRAAPDGHAFVRVRPKVPWRAEGTAPDDGLVSMPLIIPPVKNKNYEYFGELFRTLWSKAEDALAAADDIVIIGYSFPVTDVQSDALFRRAFVRRKTIPRINILDPNPDGIARKFIEDLGIPKEKINVCKEYFSSSFDLDTILYSDPI